MSSREQDARFEAELASAYAEDPEAFGLSRRSLAAKIADELRHNDECGSRRPLSDREYMDDAAAILRIVREHAGPASNKDRP
jgi:hypothetical protein